MFVRKPRAAGLAALSLLFGCAGAPLPQATTAARGAEAGKRQKPSVLESAWCLRAATESGCSPGREVSFKGEYVRRGQSAEGTFLCEGGRPHARMAIGGKAVDGEIAQVTWEAVWRVVDASDGCVSAFGAPATVTVSGRPNVCNDREGDLTWLLAHGYSQARSGPPRRDWDGTRICELEPSACGASIPPCPSFQGDEWNGVRQKDAPRTGE